MIDREVKALVLRVLLPLRGKPLPDGSLKGFIRTGFGAAFTDGDLTQWLREMETTGLLAATDDEVLGIVWALTPKGTIRAQQL